MVRRSKISLSDLAAPENLLRAYHRAVRGKRTRHDVWAFDAGFDREMEALSRALLGARLRLRPYRAFRIHDPKERWIHAPPFRDRVLHHAIMRHVAPVLERALVDDTFACRVGKGSWAAVEQVQRQLGRHPWYVKVDIRGYFASIDHGLLQERLQRRIKGRGISEIFRQLLASYEDVPGKGLPIGALPSQHFANFYLGDLDRYLLETLRVRGMVRYMDDVIWWVDEPMHRRKSLEAVRDFVRRRLDLTLKPNCVQQRSSRGVTFCGYRVLPDRVLLTPRGKKLHRIARRRWESAWSAGLVDERRLQAGFATAVAPVQRADARAWLRAQCARDPGPEV